MQIIIAGFLSFLATLSTAQFILFILWLVGGSRTSIPVGHWDHIRFHRVICRWVDHHTGDEIQGCLVFSI